MDAPSPGEVVGMRVKEHRELRQLTQQDLADRLRDRLDWPLDRSTLARIEAGDRQVNIAELFKLAAALDTTPVLLMTQLDESAMMQALPWRAMTSSRVRAWIAGSVPLWEQDREAYAQSADAGWRLTRDFQDRVNRLFDRIAVLYNVESLDEVAPDVELTGLARATEDVLNLEIELAMKRHEWLTHVGEWAWDDLEPSIALFERHPRFTSESAHELFGQSPHDEAEARIAAAKPAVVAKAADAAAEVRGRVEAVLSVVSQLRAAVEARVDAISSKQKFGRLTSPPRDSPA